MAELLSVNVGTPRDVAWNGRRVHTGAWKRPVDGAVTARRLGLDGDGQGDTAGHGGENRAVLVYQLESYRFWQERLSRGPLELGTFAENLTVDGLPDDEVCIGDRYQVGGAEFEVTQPRVTCYRAGLRLGEPALAALLVAEHRPGFYMRVVREGPVRAGDAITRTRSGPGHVSVSAIDALLYLPDRDRETLRRAVAVPALSPGWHTSLSALLDQDEAPADGSARRGDRSADASVPAESDSSWTGFRALRVTRVVRETADIVSVFLGPTDGSTLPAARPGQYLPLRVPIEQGVIRSYSVSAPPVEGAYRISVKRADGGVVSGFLHESLRVGCRLEVAAPRGDFLLEAGTAAVVLVCAGIGATPVLAMLHALVAAGSRREVWWLQTARDRADAPFRTEVRSLLARLERGRSRFYYTRHRDADRLDGDEVAGRLGRDAIAGLGLPHGAVAYVCGPSSFMDEVTAALGAAGLAADDVHREAFGARSAITPGIVDRPSRAPHRPDGPAGDGPMVTFARSGVAAPFGPAPSSLLEFAEACDIPARWQCRTGVCRTCETPLLAGDLDYDPTPLSPPQPGTALVCCARPRNDTVLDM